MLNSRFTEFKWEFNHMFNNHTGSSTSELPISLDR
jgi:hypothetical protein